MHLLQRCEGGVSARKNYSSPGHCLCNAIPNTVQEEVVEMREGKWKVIVESPRLVDPSSSEEPVRGPRSTVGPRAVLFGCACGMASSHHRGRKDVGRENKDPTVAKAVDVDMDVKMEA